MIVVVYLTGDQLERFTNLEKAEAHWIQGTHCFELRLDIREVCISAVNPGPTGLISIQRYPVKTVLTEEQK